MKSDYTVVGTTLTFAAAVPNGALVEVQTFAGGAKGDTGSSGSKGDKGEVGAGDVSKARTLGYNIVFGG